MISSKSAFDVLEFNDFRSFLLRYQKYQKAKRPLWSHRTWARTLRLGDVSTLTKVLTGQRNPGDDLVAKMITYFDFDSVRATHFRDLIQLDKLKSDPRLSLMIMEKLQRKPKNSNFKEIKSESYSVLSKWYLFAIREIVKTHDFQNDPQWISERFPSPLQPGEISKCIDELVTLNLLQRSNDGTLEVSDVGFYETMKDVPSRDVRNYHKAWLDKAKDALDLFDINQRVFSASTFAVRLVDLPKFKESLSEFKDKILQMAEGETYDQVYQLQFQLFPVLKTRTSRRAKDD